MISERRMLEIEERISLHNENERRKQEYPHQSNIIEGKGILEFLARYGVLLDLLKSQPDIRPDNYPDLEKFLWDFLNGYDHWKIIAKKVKARSKELMEWYTEITKRGNDENEEKKGIHLDHRS